MTEQRPWISVIDPLGPAFEQVKLVLFRPFDFNRWFVIGFCAWLAGLGQGGFGFNYRPHRRRIQPGEFFQGAGDYVLENLAWVIPAAACAAIFLIVLWLVLVWLSSRGRFMFLHCVAQDKAEVVLPWKKFRRHANSLFVFRVVLGLTGFVAALLPALLAFFLVLAAVHTAWPGVGLIASLVIGVTVMCVILVAFAVVWKFTKDFVVPIMFLRTTSCVAAWREFLPLLSGRKGIFALYILFQIVMALAIGVILLSAGALTCCSVCCLLMIPYIRTVTMLPVLVFTRAYSLHFLRQFGPEFDCFIVDAVIDAQ